jgi:hypothetical protein
LGRLNRVLRRLRNRGGLVLEFFVVRAHGTGFWVVRFSSFALFQEAVGSTVANFSTVETAVFFEPLFSFHFGQGTPWCSI